MFSFPILTYGISLQVYDSAVYARRVDVLQRLLGVTAYMYLLVSV